MNVVPFELLNDLLVGLGGVGLEGDEGLDHEL